MKQTIAFINYISRSGSTLLCRLLDAYNEISVGIEAGFPGFMTELVPEKYNPMTSKKQLDHYLDELYEDIRFKEWQVNRTSLIARLGKIGYPITFQDILLSCLQEYFGHHSGVVWVHKAGYYVDLLDEVRASFPGSKNIYMVRDPRAIFLSQKNATCLYTGKSMGSSLCYFIYQYKKRMRIVMNNSKSKDLLVIKYEELVQEDNYVEKNVLPFLGIPDAISGEDNYANKIPENQKFLHTNVSAQPNKKSIAKWKNGLQNHEVVFIQNKLKNEMKFHGYDLGEKKKKIPWRERFFYLQKEVEYMVFFARIYFRKIKLFFKVS